MVGAGAAGLMTAITARHDGLRVLLLDGKEKIGAKILMSGGTRCNITNLAVTENDFGTETKRTVRHVLNAFPSDQVVEFFGDLGVEVLLEEGGKFFPVTHSAKTVLEALLKQVRKSGVCLAVPRKVTRVVFNDDRFLVQGSNFFYVAETVVLCTGGLSYPSTGSDGIGYEIAKSFGHRLIFTTPSLTPLKTDDEDWKSLMGVSLPACLTLRVEQKKVASYEGSFLFTHFGFSGPVILNMSRHWIRYRQNCPEDSVALFANFLPAEEETSFRDAIHRTSREHPTHSLRRFLALRLPERFVETLLKKLDLAGSILGQTRREDRENLIRALFYFPLKVMEEVGYLKAEATAGGIDLAEVDSKTLESKLQPGLFFSGEMLDADGRIGGFNFQWAWSSGRVAGRGVIKRIHEIRKAS